MQNNPELAFLSIILLSIVGYFIAIFVIGRGLIYIAKRTETRVDDIIIKHLHPFRVAWLAPLIVINSLA